jgi:thioesterase domain-containing protein
LTAALGAEVLSCEAGRVRVAAPLAPNLNHRNTAFGGSLATLGIVSGWALLHFALRRENIDARLVIQKNECEFIEPVAQEFVAESCLPEAEWQRFVNTLTRRRRARIVVQSDIRAAGLLAVKSSGTYVALL